MSYVEYDTYTSGAEASPDPADPCSTSKVTMRPTFSPTEILRYQRAGGAWDDVTLDALTRRGADGGGMSVVDGDRHLDAGILDAAVGSLAGSLRAAGVDRGDVVSWQLPNWYETVILYRACWRVGAVAAPIHHQVGGDEVARMVKRLDPVVAFAAPGMALAEVTPSVAVRGDDATFASMTSGAAMTHSPALPADVALVLFTSGSSGEPKGVLHTHRGLAYKMRSMVGVHGLGADDASLMPLPMAHVSGLLNGLLVPAAARMTSVLMSRWDPAQGLELIEANHVSFMVGPPPLFGGLIATPGFSAERVASMRVVSTGAMGVSTDFVTDAADRLGAQVKRSYGATEIPTITTCHFDDTAERGRETDGRALGEGEVRTVDPVTGIDVGPGEAGEVWFRGPEMFAGYLDPEATDDAVSAGWFRTGDLGELDGDGWLRIVGRIKDVIIRGGENIAPAEVQRVLEDHPAICQAVAVGYPDAQLGERVAAFVVGGPFGIDECRDWFRRAGVAKFKVPELVVCVDAVPILPAGKPDLALLRARAVAAASEIAEERGRPRGSVAE